MGEAVRLLKRGHAQGVALKTWRYRSAQSVAYAERLLVMDRRLFAIQNGVQSPANSAEALALANFALRRKLQPRVAARLFQTALGDKGLSPRLRFEYQVNAASAALLCVGGKVEKGAKAPKSVEAERLRNQALE